jgi:hypothetical protein
MVSGINHFQNFLKSYDKATVMTSYKPTSLKVNTSNPSEDANFDGPFVFIIFSMVDIKYAHKPEVECVFRPLDPVTRRRLCVNNRFDWNEFSPCNLHLDENVAR